LEEYLAEIERIKNLDPDPSPDYGMSAYYALRGEREKAIEQVKKSFAPEESEESYPNTDELSLAHDTRVLACRSGVLTKRKEH